MTTTTDLLRRAAESLRRHGYHDIPIGLNRIADEMERAEPVAWTIRHYSPDCGYFHECHLLEERGYPPFEVEKYTPLYTHPAPDVQRDAELVGTVRTCTWNGQSWTISMIVPTKMRVGDPLYTHATPDVQRDAERYRWIKENEKFSGAIDAVIDAQIAAMQEPKP